MQYIRYGIGSLFITRPARVCISLACPEMSSFAFFPTASHLLIGVQFGGNLTMVHLETDRSLVQVICSRVPVGTEQ